MNTQMVGIILECLRSVRHPRFFETERGYQGELLAELRARLPQVALLGDAIVEQEYQKRLCGHDINIRPDIIIHVPTPDGDNRKEGNFAVFELNLHAGPAEACEDFANLDAVLGGLNYPLGVFVNIDSTRTQASHYGGVFGERLHFFSVRQMGGEINLRHAYFREGEVVEESETVV